jgi:hypothetical protein
VRRFWLDAGIASLEQRYEVSYHALSQRYLVRNLNTGEQQDFGTLEAALDRISVCAGCRCSTPRSCSRDRSTKDASGRAGPEHGAGRAGLVAVLERRLERESDWVTWTLRP